MGTAEILFFVYAAGVLFTLARIIWKMDRKKAGYEMPELVIAFWPIALAYWVLFVIFDIVDHWFGKKG